MLILISNFLSVHDVIDHSLWFLKAHGLAMLGAFVAGTILVFLLYSLLGFRRLRVIRRIINLAEDADLELFRYGSFINRITVRRLSKNGRRHVRNLQAPAARGVPGGTENLLRIDDRLIYYFPENSLAFPEGLQLPEYATWVYGNPPEVELPLRIVPVMVTAAGGWYPAVVRESTGLTHSRWSVPRAYWKHGYRNLFIGDFVMVGDILGTVTVPEIVKHHVVVRAPCSGFILQFGAYPFTPVVQGASVMLIGAVAEIAMLPYPGDLAGFFRSNPGGRKDYVGMTVERDASLATVHILYGSFQIPITAPMRMHIVRQFVTDGDAVQYGEQLFAYIPL